VSETQVPLRSKTRGGEPDALFRSAFFRLSLVRERTKVRVPRSRD
jgi:hypothetical protein